MNKSLGKSEDELVIKISQLEAKISELEESNLQNHNLLESSPVCTKIIDLDFNLQFMSNSGIRDLKIDDITAFYGKPYPLHFYPDSFKIQMTKNLKRVKKTGETLTQEAPIEDIKGNILWYHSTISPVYNGREQLEAIMVVSIETTANKKLEEALKHSKNTVRNKLKAINTLEGNIDKLELSDIIDVEVLQSLMDDFYQLTGMLGAVLDVSGKVLVAVGWQDICTKFHRCNPNSLKNCIESDTILTHNVPQGTFKSYKCKNNMWDIVTPIIVGEMHVGNVFMGQYFLKDELPDIEFFREQSKKYGFDETAYLAALDRAPRFTQEEVNTGMKFYSKLTEIISTLSFSTIQQSRLLAEREQVEDKIRTAEKNLKETFDLSPSIIAKVNLNTGYFLEVNKAVTRMLGYTANEFTSKPFIEFIHPDDRLMTEDKRFEKQKLKKGTYFENRYLCKDGSFKWISWNSTKVNKNGVVTAIGSDTTERKLAQLKLHRSTQLLEASQSIAKLGGWELDISSNNLFWTAETYRIHETSPEEFNPTVDAGVGYFLPDSRRLISNALEAAIKNGEGYDLELETLTTKGHRIDVRTTCKVTLLNGKPIKLTGIFQDITEQKKVERKIRAAEKNLKNTFDLSPSIICKGNVNTGYFVEANLAVKRILGYSFEEFTAKPFVKLVHPDDRRSTIDQMSKLRLGKEMTFFENRYLCKDGSYKWLSWHGSKADQHGIVTAIASDISERKMIEQEIVATKQFYENIIEGVQDGIWVTDKNDVIFYANLAMEKIAGVPIEKIKGKDISQETIGEFKKFYTQAKNEKKPVWYEIKAITPGGKNVCQNGWLIPQYKNKSFNGIICTVRDISERKKAEINVRKLSTAVQQSPSTIIIADTKGILEYVNPKFLEVTGYSKDELIGENLNIFKSGKQNSVFYKEMWARINSGEVWRGQFHNKKKNGEFYWDAASISAIYNESGDVINFIKIGEDITPQKKTETDLKIALEKALESDRLKSAFLSNMSHEIRTPMNGILGFINLLNEPNLSNTQISEYSTIINKSGDRLLNTINDIIDISKIEAGEVVISKAETFINNEFEEVYSFFLPEAKRKGLSLFMERSNANEQLTVITDSHKLHGILTNLIKNAIKYTEKGNVIFGYLLKEDFIEFYVKDTGIGIPKERLKAIFNRFEQADIEDSRVFEGSGLGLAIAKAYTNLLGGDISVESREGKGSKFTFAIPYSKKVEIKIEQQSNNTNTNTNRMGNLNLLIVEDDVVSSYFLETLLEDNFQKITIAKNGIEAVEYCKNNPEINLVLMDIKMPKMNGYEATKEIRKFNKELFIIAQTAYAMHGDKDKAIEAGCNDYIVKPINKELLLQIINNLFS